MKNWHMTVARLLPPWLVYACAVRLMAHATTHRYSNKTPDEASVIAALKEWNLDAS